MTSVPVLSALRVVEGFEAAVGAAFEDELSAPAGRGRSRVRRQVSGLISGRSTARRRCPHGVRPLAEVVTRPPVLGRSLAYAGWVENAEAGRGLQRNLVPGQRLVDRDGRLWRWDGFTRIAAGTFARCRSICATRTG